MDINLLLKVGDASENGQVTIIDEDRLCYLVESISRGAVGIRTISKALLKEFIQYLSQHPDSNANQARKALSGTSNIDRFEYGYASTLMVMADMALKVSKHRASVSNHDKMSGESHQQIFYGAPGTGKSFAINELIKDEEVIRTTFHPDSDYSTFVGAFKPTIEDVDVQVVPVVLANNGISLEQNKGTYKENRITYKFVKQAFLKAYIKAWKSFTQLQRIVLSTNVREKADWILCSMDDEAVNYIKKVTVSIPDFETAVKKKWEEFIVSTDLDKFGKETNGKYEATACFWFKESFKDKIENYVDVSKEDFWKQVKGELEGGGKIEYTPGGSQTYSITLENEKIVITSNTNFNNRAKRDKIKECFDSQNGTEPKSVQEAIAQRLKEYKTSFDGAWDKLKDDIEKTQNSGSSSFDSNDLTPQYLVIEEINRGNCAQVFGDLFQLLDRKNGFSSYPIDADEDIRRALLEDNPEDKLSFGKDGLSLSQEQRDYINQHYDQGDDVATKIQKGQVLVLPPNLYIWATMNTSDQSLFPIDSAFKRRWEWVYVPIQYEQEFILDGETKTNRSYDFIIKIDDNNQYHWIKFIQKVNKKIRDLTGSEDKQIGNYFVDLPNGETEIDEKTFKNKVMFYLWNDICKDEFGNPNSFYRTKEKEFSFNELFEADGQKLLIGFLDNIEDIKITTSKPAGTTPPVTPPENTPPTGTPSGDGDTPNEGDEPEQ